LFAFVVECLKAGMKPQLHNRPGFVRLWRTQLNEGGAPAAVFRVVERERKDGGVSRQDGVNAAAEVSDAFAVDDAHLENAFLEAGLKVFRDEFADVLRAERVEIQDTVDRQFMRFIHGGNLPGRLENESLGLA